MSKINKAALPSLIFAFVFFVIVIIRFNSNNLIDTGFYALAILGFVVMFFITNKRK